MGRNILNGMYGKQLKLLPNEGDICPERLVGRKGYRTLYWSTCSRCGNGRWANKCHIGKICGDCNRTNNIRREKISKTLTGRKRDWSPSEEQIQAIKKALIGKKCTPEHKEKVRQASLRQWRNPETRYRIVKSLMTLYSPNKTEIRVLEMLNKELGNEWKFVGDGEVILGGFCPDYINTNGKKLIVEFFGEFFHEPKDEPYKKQKYAELGYDTFVIWGKDLQSVRKRENVISRMKQWIQDYEEKHKCAI